jgi:hypothetical protein
MATSVPPKELSINPMGFFNSLWSSRPKKYPAAENLSTLEGVTSYHRPAISSYGLKLPAFGTENILISGYFASLISNTALHESLTAISILDWPEQIQTSPARTFLITRFSPAFITSV